jgi:hypothetical protein
VAASVDDQSARSDEARAGTVGALVGHPQLGDRVYLIGLPHEHDYAVLIYCEGRWREARSH